MEFEEEALKRLELGQSRDCPKLAGVPLIEEVDFLLVSFLCFFFRCLASFNSFFW
jgi:hypothetical protein